MVRRSHKPRPWMNHVLSNFEFGSDSDSVSELPEFWAEDPDSELSSLSMFSIPLFMFWMPHKTQSWAALLKLQNVKHTLKTIAKFTACRHLRLHLHRELLLNNSLILAFDFPFAEAILSEFASSPGYMLMWVSNNSLLPFKHGPSPASEGSKSDPDVSSGRCLLRAGVALLDAELEEDEALKRCIGNGTGSTAVQVNGFIIINIDSDLIWDYLLDRENMTLMRFH